MINDLTLMAVFSYTQAGSFRAYIEEMPEVITEENTFEATATALADKLKFFMQYTDVDTLKLEYKFKHTFLKRDN